MKKMKFSVDSYEVVANDPSFMVVQMDIISDGVNKHGTEFLAEDIAISIPKISNKPLNCIIQYGDFSDHARSKEEEKKQVGVGTVPESNRARMIEKDGKNFLRIDAIIWKYLFPEASEIFKRRGKVEISIEITPTKVEKRENGIVVIKEWFYEAITLLGAYVSPAINKAEAIVVKYSSNEDYFETTMVKYGVLFDSFIVPNDIVEECEKALSKQNNNPNLMSLAKSLSGLNNYNYKEIIELSENLYAIDKEGSKDKVVGLIKNWFSTIIKEKEGGSKVDKIKNALLSNLKDNQKYAFHNDDKVFFFDMSVAKYKSLSYSSEEVEEVVTVKFGEEEEEVIKVEGSDEFVNELGEGQEADDSISYSIEKYTELISKIEEAEKAKADLEVKFSEIEAEKETIEQSLEAEKSKYSELEVIKTELEDRLIGFSEIEKDFNELKEYKVNKEKELKTNAINTLYSKYRDFLSKEEVDMLNEKSESMDMSDFSKEVYSVVMPKFEAKIEAMTSEKETDASKDNLKYTSTPKETKKEEPESNSLLSRLERI